jgi:hypothetical protein
MADVRKLEGSRSLKVPEFLKEPLEAAQERIERLEGEAQRVWKDLMLKGRAGRKDLEQIVSRLAKQDWNLLEMRQLLDRLREQGLERAAEWRGKAESFRADALERMVLLQGKAVAFLGVATREQVEELSRELERLAKRIERQRPAKSGKGARKGGKPSAQV